MTNRLYTGAQVAGIVASAILFARCGLFTPRSPEAPTQPSNSFRPATDPDAVVENLQSAIEQKDAVNYIRCFADPARARTGFSYTPSSGAAAQYGAVFAHWTIDEERQYFQNLVARAAGKSGAYSSLVLSHKTVTMSGDSAVQSYDYTLTFDHNDPSLSQTAVGTMQIVLSVDNTNSWVIYRWADFNTSSDVTWSKFRGRFSN